MEHTNITHSSVAQVEQLETHEIAEEPNLAELRSYLAQYGEMIVESPRLPGVPLPLNALMNACPKDPTEETAPEYLAEAQALVAAAQAKEPEPESEEEDSEQEVEAEKDIASEESKKKLI